MLHIEEIIAYIILFFLLKWLVELVFGKSVFSDVGKAGKSFISEIQNLLLRLVLLVVHLGRKVIKGIGDLIKFLTPRR